MWVKGPAHLWNLEYGTLMQCAPVGCTTCLTLHCAALLGNAVREQRIMPGGERRLFILQRWCLHIPDSECTTVAVGFAIWARRVRG